MNTNLSPVAQCYPQRSLVTGLALVADRPTTIVIQSDRSSIWLAAGGFTIGVGCNGDERHSDAIAFPARDQPRGFAGHV